MKLFFFITILFCHSQKIFCQNLDYLCKIIVVDEETKDPVFFSQVFGQLGELIKIDSSNFLISCIYSDSLMVEAVGYESKMIKYHHGLDTVYLKMNDYLLEPVLVSSKKNKSKHYILGKRHKRWKRFTSYGLDFHQNQRFISYFPNNLFKKFKIEEGYVFLMKDLLENGDTIPLQLQIQFFEVKGDTLGKTLSDVILVIDNDKEEGWFQLKIEEHIEIPKEGMFVSVQCFDNVKNYISLGLMEYKEELGIDSYISTNNKWYLFPYDMNKQDVHVGVKMYFKVKK